MGLIGKLLALLGLTGAAAIVQSDGQAESETLEKLRSTSPFRIVTVPGRNALAEWEKLKGQGEGWPVIIGSDEDLERVLDQFSFDAPDELQSVQDILAASAKISVPATLQELYDDEYGEDPFDMPNGEWPKSGSFAPMTLTVDKAVLTGRAFPRVHIMVIPTDDPTEVPAYLRWGGWNACPSPEVQVAAHRKWRTQYGAEIVGISGDVINMRVARRPATREEAMALAKEQYLYCSDIVLQGTDTLEALAMSLMESDWWYFWWD